MICRAKRRSVVGLRALAFLLQTFMKGALLHPWGHAEYRILQVARSKLLLRRRSCDDRKRGQNGFHK